MGWSGVLRSLRRPAVKFDRALQQKIETEVERWREVLGRRVPQARQIVAKLLVDRLTFRPEGREGQNGFTFEATGTVAKLISGVVPGQLSTREAVASPSGIEPESRP